MGNVRENFNQMAHDVRNATPTVEKNQETVEETFRGNTRLYLQMLYGFEPGSAFRPPSPPFEKPLYTRSRWEGITSPFAVLFVAMLSFGYGASMTSHTSDTNAVAGSTNSPDMETTSKTNTANVPNASQDHGNQVAKYVVDPDGAKHFTLTAMQVMWEVIGITAAPMTLSRKLMASMNPSWWIHDQEFRNISRRPGPTLRTLSS
jgi:hypothetical protein